jgi:hypothetical protein
VIENNFNLFTAKVANKRLLGTPPKSLFGTKSHKHEQLITYQYCFIKAEQSKFSPPALSFKKNFA